MLTESTGSALCDSGGDSGRHWQRNQKKTIQDFINEPECTLETYEYKNGQWDLSPTISLFHKLTSSLDLDDLCNEFNSMEVENWNSDYYGVSSEGFEWLENLGFKAIGEAYNSYNGDSILSQVVQGQQLEFNGDDYIGKLKGASRVDSTPRVSESQQRRMNVTEGLAAKRPSVSHFTGS